MNDEETIHHRDTKGLRVAGPKVRRFEGCGLLAQSQNPRPKTLIRLQVYRFYALCSALFALRAHITAATTHTSHRLLSRRSTR